MAPINVGVIGYGMSARIFHIPFVLALPDMYKLHTIVQRNPNASSNSTGASATTDHPDVRVVPTHADLFDDPDIELIIITTPPDSHYQLCHDALQAGKHVVCEKPFVPTSAEAKELAAHAKSCNRVLSVFQNRRWDANYVTLAELYRSGKLGRIVEWQTHFDRHRPGKPAGGAVRHAWKADTAMPANGAIYDLGTHLIDQVVALLGAPAKVTAFLAVQRDGRVGGDVDPAEADAFTALLHYKDGALVTVKAGVVSAETEPLRFWIRGTEGTFRKCHLDIQEDQLVGGLMPWQDGYAVEPESWAGSFTAVRDGQLTTISLPVVQAPTYTAFYKGVGDAIRDGGHNPVPPMEAGLVLNVIEKAIESSRTWSTQEVVV